MLNLIEGVNFKGIYVFKQYQLGKVYLKTVFYNSIKKASVYKLQPRNFIRWYIIVKKKMNKTDLITITCLRINKNKIK